MCEYWNTVAVKESWSVLSIWYESNGSYVWDLRLLYTCCGCVQGRDHPVLSCGFSDIILGKFCDNINAYRPTFMRCFKHGKSPQKTNQHIFNSFSQKSVLVKFPSPPLSNLPWSWPHAVKNDAYGPLLIQKVGNGESITMQNHMPQITPPVIRLE